MYAQVGEEKMHSIKLLHEQEQWYFLPPGNCRKVEGILQELQHLVHPNNPPVKYQQGDTNDCVFCSDASVFYCFGWEEEGARFNKAREEFKLHHGINAWPIFIKLIRDKKKSSLNLWQLKNFDPLTTDVIKYPVVASLQASDNSCNHAVACCHGYIFDSNLEKAVCRDKAVLDWCCSTDSENFEYKSCGKAYEITEKWGYRGHKRKRDNKPEKVENKKDLPEEATISKASATPLEQLETKAADEDEYFNESYKDSEAETKMENEVEESQGPLTEATETKVQDLAEE